MAPPKLSPQTLAALIQDTRSARFVDEEDELLGGHEGQERANSSIIGDLFSVLARPSRAVASSVHSIVDDDEDTTPLQGLLAGLKGESETTFSDVLGEMGVTNRPARAIGGFAGDVLLDPLTYVGVKSVKGTSKAQSQYDAIKALTEAGENVSENTVAQKAMELRSLDPAHTYVTFAGKKISPSWETPNTVGASVKDKIIGPEENRNLAAKIFSRKSELPFGLADSSRVLEAENTGKFQLHYKALRDQFKDLTPEEGREVSLAIERGEDLSARVPTVKKEGFQTLEDYKQLAQKTFKNFFDDESKLGLYKPEQYKDNYLYKFSKKGIPERMPGLPASARIRGNLGNSVDETYHLLSQALKSGDPDTIRLLGKKMSDYSLEDYELAGLEPATHISEILGMRAQKHYRTVARQGFVRDAIERFGTDITDKNRDLVLSDNFKYRPAGEKLAAPVAKSEDLANKWLPENIIRVLNQTEEVLRDGQVGAEFTRFYDTAIGAWKSLNTMWNPGYHVRNSISDGIINFMDGVTNPTLYDRSTRVLRAAKDLDISDLMGQPGSATGVADAAINVGKYNKLTGKDVWRYYLASGSKSGHISAEISPTSDLNNRGVGAALSRAETAKNLVRGRIQDFGEKREDFFRVAHFIKGVEDELKARGINRAATHNELTEASRKAGERVRKYNIDYGALSSAEKNVMRRIIPFYGWMRRNLPLQVELLFTKPGYMAAYPKGQDLLQGMLGTDNGEGDYLIPKWIRDSAPVRLALGQNEGNVVQRMIRKMAGAGPGDAVFTPTVSSMTPIGDLQTLANPIAKGIETGSPVQGLLETAQEGFNMLTPAIKAPAEAAFQRSAFTGQPITDWKTWLMSQVGPTRMGARAFDEEQRPRALASYILGANFQPVTVGRQASEFRRREDVVNSRIRDEKLNTISSLGIEEPTQQLYNKIQTPETVRMQAYKRNTLRILGYMGHEDSV